MLDATPHQSTKLFLQLYNACLNKCNKKHRIVRAMRMAVLRLFVFSSARGHCVQVLSWHGRNEYSPLVGSPCPYIIYIYKSYMQYLTCAWMHYCNQSTRYNHMCIVFCMCAGIARCGRGFCQRLIGNVYMLRRWLLYGFVCVCVRGKTGPGT